jgi:hypothetical protein
MTRWEIKAKELVNCTCSYGCPCQFNAPPTHGHCAAVGAFEIAEGWHGGVRLDGLKAIGIMQWPGAIHEGHGKAQVIIDERATEAQRSVLVRIMSGEDTVPGKTMWNVFASTMETVYEPLFEPIELDIDIEGRRGRVRVGDRVQVRGEPIRNPVTGEEHRARIDLPHGFEYRIAEIGSGSATVRGTITLDLDSSYAQFARIHLCQDGVVG